MEIIDIILFLIAGGGALFLKHKLQNNNALRENEKANEQVDKLQEEGKRMEALLKEEAEIRAKMKEDLKKEIEREPTDEELADFITERYTNGRN